MLFGKTCGKDDQSLHGLNSRKCRNNKTYVSFLNG